MKKTAACLAGISSIFLFSTTLLHAAEKKVIFNTESMKYESDTGAERCQDKCGRRSAPDVKSLLSDGWKIVSSSSKEVIAEQYWYVPCNTCQPHGCICIGTEYVLARDERSTKVETTHKEFDSLDKNKQTGFDRPKVETSKNELDFLKKENELLKQENTLLRQENENLKNQLKSKQK